MQKKRQIACFSTPFDEQSVNMLCRLEVPAFKIASADITHLPLIKHAAAKQLPIFLSTGMASNTEIDEAVEVIENQGNHEIVLMHCMTSYPTRAEDANLEMIRMLKKRYSKYVIGYSDHTLGTTIPICSVAYGVKALEKHFTFDGNLKKSPDHRLSLDPGAFARMVKGMRDAEAARGSEREGGFMAESDAVKYARRSIVATKKIPKGVVITEEMLAIKRPATGIYPKFLDKVIGSISAHEIEADTPIQWENIGR